MHHLPGGFFFFLAARLLNIIKIIIVYLTQERERGIYSRASRSKFSNPTRAIEALSEDGAFQNAVPHPAQNLAVSVGRAAPHFAQKLPPPLLELVPVSGGAGAKGQGCTSVLIELETNA